MLYVRICFDRPNSSQLRTQVRPDHRAYVLSRVLLPEGPCRVVQAGPLCVGDSDNANLGSFMILEAKSEADIRHFHDEDPFTKVGLYEKVIVHRWDRHIG